jgi:hypothetical protein
MGAPYSVTVDRLPLEEWLRPHGPGPIQAIGAWSLRRRILALRPHRRGRILGSYGPCRAPHQEDGKPAPIPHYHYHVQWTRGGTGSARSDDIVGHP